MCAHGNDPVERENDDVAQESDSCKSCVEQVRGHGIQGASG